MRFDDAGDAINCDLHIIDGVALKAPSFNDDALASSDEAIARADRLDHRVSLDVPAVVTGEVAVLRCLTQMRVTDAETNFGNLFAGVLISNACRQRVDSVVIQTDLVVDEAL